MKRQKENSPENIMLFVLGKQVCQLTVEQWDSMYPLTTPQFGGTILWLTNKIVT